METNEKTKADGEDCRSDGNGCDVDVGTSSTSISISSVSVENGGDLVTEETALETKSDKPETGEPLPALMGAMAIGEMKFGITCTGEPVGRSHWLADSAVCGDLVMALPSSVLIAGRTKEASGVAVDMGVFLDAIVEGASRLCGIPGIVEAAGLPAWSVSRLMGTFPALMQVYNETIDQAVLLVEAAAIKASIGMKLTNRREHRKTKKVGDNVVETNNSVETLDREIPPDPSLSRFILTNRMKSRYKDDGDVKQAVQINIMGAEADL